jgi:MYXO-CTERM domain-containing protein
MASIRASLCGAALLLASVPAGRVQAQEVTCYVDSAGGDDGNSGLSEAEAVRSQAKIGQTCTIVRFKRGSVFGEALKITTKVKTYTNYGDGSAPLPQFVVPHTASSGSLVNAYQGGITVDGLYLAGSHGDGTMNGLGKGVCVSLGGNSQLLNNEITNCDIGIMLMGAGTLVQGNYVHDLTMAVDAAPGVDPNAVGGAEGIFINGSSNEVAYNSFVNCSNTAAWTGGNCDGGATEVTVGNGGNVSGVKIHHNFSYNSCGFFEVSSGFGGSKGLFSDSEFSYNVMIDSGWMMLLQVNNTDLANVRWENNTVIQHAGSTNAGMITTIFTGTSSGVSGGALAAGSVLLTNNLIVFDGVRAFGDVIDPAITQTTNLVVDTSKQDPGFVNLAGTINAADFDLVAGSPAINAGTVLAHLPVDYLNRAVPDPASGQTDIGAFEFNSIQVDTPPPSSPVPISATGGAGEGGAQGHGCTCRLASAPGGSGPRILLLGLVLGLVLRRRRAQRKKRRTRPASVRLDPCWPRWRP